MEEEEEEKKKKKNLYVVRRRPNANLVLVILRLDKIIDYEGHALQPGRGFTDDSGEHSTSIINFKAEEAKCTSSRQSACLILNAQVHNNVKGSVEMHPW
jgi:chemotaxis signal transduction protein